MLARDPRIEVVEPNRLREPLAIPDDPKYSTEWGLKLVNAPRAWSYTPGRFATASAPIHVRPLIAVVDTGVDCTHPDFANAGGTSKNAALGGQLSFTKSKTYVNTTVSPAACAWQDDYGHGTHVAGIIGAATSNGIGVTGLAYGAVIAAYKTSNSSGMSSDYAICQAIMAAADAGATVISISLGGPGYSQTMQDAVEYAWRRNVLVIAAAGNANTNKVYFPGAATHAIAVAAVDGNRVRASFSNYGHFIGIAAPGVGIISTAPTYTNTMGVKDYTSMSGTSMATPHVSGAAGLLAMAYPGARMTAVAARLQQAASSSKAGGGWDQYLGYGVLDAGAATTGTLRPASVGGITGQVTNTTNSPIYAAVVSAGGVSFTTGPDGLFHLGNLPAGVRQVTVSATGFPFMSFGVTVPAGADVVVTAQLGATMGSYTGYVSSGGAGLAGAVVEAISGGLVQASVITAANGSFTLPIVAGTYDLRASGLGYISRNATAVAAHAGGPTSVDFTLPRLGNIAGTVTDSAGPKANVQILVSNAAFEAGAITNANGQFATLGLPAGTYKVTAQATGFADVVATGVSVALDTTAHVPFSLAAGLASVSLSTASATGPATVGNNRVTLTAPAPAGGAVVALSSSSPIATVPATLVVPAGATSATFAVQLSAVATSTSVTISASWKNSTKTATLTDLRPVISLMYVSTTAVPPGGSTTATAYITGAAPAGGATIALSDSSSAVALPAYVVVPAGKNSVAFAVSVASTAPAGTATISGSYGTVTKSGTLIIGSGSAPAALSAISVSPAALMGGTSSSSNVVTLTGPAPAAGAVVSLTSSSLSVSVPASVTVPAGATSASFRITAANVSTNVSATITALYGGVARSDGLSVTASNGTPLSSVYANPTSVTGGTSSTGNRVWLAGAAPAGGTVVVLSSSSSTATVPATVTVPAGLTYANFTINTSIVAANTNVTITAASGGVSRTTVVTVLPPAAKSLFLRSVVGGGTSWDNLVYLTGPAPAAGAVVSITASAGVVVPATVRVPAGATSVNFPITSSAVSANTTYTIYATYGGVTKTGGLTIMPR